MSGYAQKKVSYGVGLDIFQTQLNNVDREHFSGYGHSVPDFTQNDKLGFGVNGILRMPIYKNMGLETGLGLARYHSQFHFEYLHFFTQQWISAKFNIGLDYLKLPLNLYYEFRLSKSSSLIISGGINLKLLLWTNDNFNKIVVEEIGLPNEYKRYEPLVYAYSGSLSYKCTFQSKKSFELGVFMGEDLNKAVNRNTRLFGFYENLYPASYSQYGISIKYFFHSLNL